MSSNTEQRANITFPDETAHADDASDSGESFGSNQEQETKKGEGLAFNRHEKLERLKREKRLAMNRECARARRRRKKLRMEILEQKVTELTHTNNHIQVANDALQARVMQLEAELSLARSNKATLSLIPKNAGSLGFPSSFLGAGSGTRMAGSGLSADSQALIAEKLNLQRRSALAGLSGTTAGLGSFGAGDQATALRYMQLMQAKSAIDAENFAAKKQYGAGGLFGEPERAASGFLY